MQAGSLPIIAVLSKLGNGRHNYHVMSGRKTLQMDGLPI